MRSSGLRVNVAIASVLWFALVVTSCAAAPGETPVLKTEFIFASAPFKSLPAHCETIVVSAVRFSLPFGSELAHVIAPCGSREAQLDATACNA